MAVQAAREAEGKEGWKVNRFGYSCHARERGDLCGAEDCMTCHPENFDDDGYLIRRCEQCGKPIVYDSESDVCDRCAEKNAEEELDIFEQETRNGPAQQTGQNNKKAGR